MSESGGRSIEGKVCRPHSARGSHNPSIHSLSGGEAVRSRIASVVWLLLKLLCANSKMCRICGRMVKCIFDTMPSRTYQVPSRRCLSTLGQTSQRHLTRCRAFSTLRRAPTASSRSMPILRQTTMQQPVTSLTSSFSCLRLTSQPAISSTYSASPKLAASQIRSFSASSTLGAPRNTYNPSRRVQKRRHGFLSRIRTQKGQQILKRRRLKGRKYLSW